MQVLTLPSSGVFRLSGKKAGGKWQRITWEQALMEIADKLSAVKDKYGNASIGYFDGTGPRTTLFAGGALYYGSMGREIVPLRNLIPDPLIEMHPDTADELDLKDGDWVWVETPQVLGERVKFRVKRTTDIDPRVVHAAFGWWFPEKPAPEYGCLDSNINVVISVGPPMEPIIGSGAVRGTLCRIYKHETKAGEQRAG